MFKKFVIVLFLCCLVTSCGKKSDPVFKESKKDNILKVSLFI